MGEGAAWARGPEVENRVCPELAGAGTLEVGWAGLDQEDVECLGVFSSYSSVDLWYLLFSLGNRQITPIPSCLSKPPLCLSLPLSPCPSSPPHPPRVTTFCKDPLALLHLS